ncbi:hypothetical protein EJD96_08400 [Herbaspirillum seropedicae]|uniref:hypothetical protein n=1 Tax=Herbaspirillum seropedicae TaxID=964 RepID=UPI00111FEDEB|nr:hypothetical protein [Herbaspirillum seropedicae]QDD64178.1 hypothetical protein EJD96_08400 [Herbaspirillum seropedicae]
MHTPWHPPLPELQASPRHLRLARGQTLQVWLAAGSQLISQANAMRVTESAQWQMERLVSRRSQLADGEWLVLAHDGWIEIHASEGGELLCFTPVQRPWHHPFLALWRWLAAQRPKVARSLQR